MLTEAFIAASSSPPKLTSSNPALLKDAGLFYHVFQPQISLRQTFKKSIAGPNCLAIGETHVFAAQSGKASVNVYSRERGTQEAVISFPQRIRSIVLAANDSILIVGNEGGGITLWEINTGRLVLSPQSHLGPVVAIAVDISSTFVLSGSEDSVVHVWSLPDLLTFSTSSTTSQAEQTTPRRTLSGHRQAVVSIAVGHSASSADIVVSASTDNSAIVWNHQSGQQLRTIFFPSTPLCIIIDIADRALYAGLSDGSIQVVDFFHFPGPSIASAGLSATPIDSLHSNRMSPPTTSTAVVGPTLCLSSSYDGTTLLSGHAGGKIAAWDVGCRHYKAIVADHPGASITNLEFLQPVGFTIAAAARLRNASITKPRLHESFSGPKGGALTDSYYINSQLPATFTSSYNPLSATTYNSRLSPPLFPDEILTKSVVDLLSWDTRSGASKCDFLNYESRIGDHPGFIGFGAIAESGASEEVDALRSQNAHLRRLQTLSNSHIEKLEREKVELKRREEQSRAMEWKASQAGDATLQINWEEVDSASGAGNDERATIP